MGKLPCQKPGIPGPPNGQSLHVVMEVKHGPLPGSSIYKDVSNGTIVLLCDSSAP